MYAYELPALLTCDEDECAPLAIPVGEIAGNEAVEAYRW